MATKLSIIIVLILMITLIDTTKTSTNCGITRCNYSVN